MDNKKIRQLEQRLNRLLLKVGNSKPKQLRRFAEACGYELVSGKKEPTYRNVYLKVDHLTIPDHSWGISKFTAKSILMQIERFLFEARAKQEGQEEGKKRQEE
jgi:hypothetical protein